MKPPPYPFPGWHGRPEDNVAPEGYRWEWVQADADWRIGGDGKRCRYTVGPNRQSCKRPAVVTLDRSWSNQRTNRWGYCEAHLFSRHIHDGVIWEGHLTRVVTASRTDKEPAPPLVAVTAHSQSSGSGVHAANKFPAKDGLDAVSRPPVAPAPLPEQI